MELITLAECKSIEKERLAQERDMARKEYQNSLSNLIYGLSDYLEANDNKAFQFIISVLKQIEKLLDDELDDIDKYFIKYFSTIICKIASFQEDNRIINFRIDEALKVIVDGVTNAYINDSDYQEDDETIAFFESKYRKAQEDYCSF